MVGKSRNEGRNQNGGVQQYSHWIGCDKGGRNGDSSGTGSLSIQSGMFSRTLAPLSAELIDHVEVRLGELAGVDQ